MFFKAAISLSLASAFLALASSAHAMDLDWAGQFRAESHWVKDYNLENGLTPAAATGGYTIRGGGSDSAHFQTLFLRLQPKLVVNDNVYIKSEWWLGDPIYGFYGDGMSQSADRRQFYSHQSRGSTITAQRFWADILTDVGTIQVGRAPLHWGLGLVWSSGDGLWDRYQSTGDVIRLISKFGAFSFVPSIIKYTMGNNVGGSCQSTSTGCTPVSGGGGSSEISLAIQYENPDEDMEGGVNFIRRLTGASQDTGVAAPAGATNGGSGFLGTNGTVGAANFNTWDLYAKKKFGKTTIAGEVPIASGEVGGLSYKTFGVALEGDVDWNDRWSTSVRAGHAPGQPNAPAGNPDKFRAFFFNPNYKLGLIMFNYQLNNFAGPNTLNSPATGAEDLASIYDNPIVNANYVNFGGLFKADKWRFSANYIFAKALETAEPGTSFYNTWSRNYQTFNGTTAQGTSLGWEMDYGIGMQWDENFVFNADFGWFFPGNFYKFSNGPTENNTATVFATVLRAGISF